MQRYVEFRERSLALKRDVILSRHLLSVASHNKIAPLFPQREFETFARNELRRLQMFQKGNIEIFTYCLCYFGEMPLDAAEHAVEGVGVVSVEDPTFKLHAHPTIWDFYKAVGYGFASRVWLK
jgi:hypothetical protein